MLSKSKLSPELVWKEVLKQSLKLPFVKVDRTEYLHKSLSPYISDDLVKKAIEMGPVKTGIELPILDKIAQGSIKRHRLAVTTLSGLSGIPGGASMFFSIPADLAQFFWHCIVIAQKLAYLYDWPEIFEHVEEIDDETLHLFTVFVGVMFGSSMANEALKKLSIELSKQIAKRVPQKALTKYAIYKLAKQVAKWIGIKLTKKSFARVLSKSIPVISGGISAGISWFTFKSMCDRLNKHLYEAAKLKKQSSS